MYKFSELHKDQSIQKIQQEAQDNFADRDELEEKADKVKTFTTAEPSLTSLDDGEEKAYDDGTNQWIYKRIGSKLYKYQLTGV